MSNLEIIENSIGYELVLIPAGAFLMGSPVEEKGRFDDEKQHHVVLRKPFRIGRTVITQEQWETVMGTQPWKGEDNVQDGNEYPAVHINWYDAVEFCRKLSAAEGKAYRLPTESEWEYACRGGTQTAFHFGDDAAKLNRYAWFDGNSSAVGEKYAHRVAQKHPSSFGLYDMHGNVWEWCHDWYGDYPSGPVPDPLGPDHGSHRVVRGGQWCVGPRYVRCAIRNKYTADERYSTLGFRLTSD